MQSFKVVGLDCSEEIGAIKQALSPLVEHDALSFDLLNGKLSVDISPDVVNPQIIIDTIKKHSGLTALPYHDTPASSDSALKPQRQTLLCYSGVMLLILGFIIHANQQGVLYAFSGMSDDLTAALPLATRLCYGLAILLCLWQVLPKAFRSVTHFRADINLLMVIAVIGALILSQWFEAAMVSVLFSIANLLEAWSIGRARRAITQLLTLPSKQVDVLCSHHGDSHYQDIETIAVGKIIRVKAGETIPLDGVITAGSSYVNQAPITGEATPINKKIGDLVFAGSLNGQGSLSIRVSNIYSDTTLATIVKLVEQAQSKRSNTQRLVDKFAKIYTPLMMLVALLVMVLPPMLTDASFSHWFYEGLVILVIACPCALVISTPLSIVSALTNAARRGIVIKGGEFMELPARISAIAFDKTGTLTEGKPTVQECLIVGDIEPVFLKQLCFSLESHSNHPVAKAIVDFCQSAKTLPMTNVTTTNGRGIEGEYNGERYWLGSHYSLHERLAQQETEQLHEQLLALEDAAHTVVIAGDSQQVLAIFSIADNLRDGAVSCLAQLRSLSIHSIHLLTGDNAGTAKAIGSRLGITHIQANLLPNDKRLRIEEMKRAHQLVAMVGDGINDAPALAASHLSIAMGAGGSDVAIETADIALLSDDLLQLPWLIQHSARCLRIIRQNIGFALSIKALFIVITLLGSGSLWLAIVADMGASLLVIANGLRLLR